MNKVMLAGRITKPVELKSLPSGSKVAVGSVATHDFRGGEERTEFHRLVFWEKLAEILLTNDAFTVIKAAKKTRNGRLAYQLLYAHYLGPNNVGNMAGEAENILKTAKYYGKKRQWNFE